MRHEPGIGVYLKMISDCAEQKANSSLMSMNLTFAQAKILGYLQARPDGAATMKEIETVVRSAQSTVCGVINRLEKKGLVGNVPMPEDKRVKRVCLTQAGFDLCEQCRQQMEQTDQWLTESLNEDEREQLKELLKRICEEKRRTIDHMMFEEDENSCNKT